VEIGSVQDDCGKYFRFLGAWKILRTHEKFIVATEEKYQGKKTASNSVKSPAKSIQSGAELIEEHDTANKEQSSGSSRDKKRPVGRKRAKDLKDIQEQRAKKLRIARQSVEAQQERNVALKTHYEIMIFTNAPPGVENSESFEYFRIMRARALASLRKEESNTGTLTQKTTEGDNDEEDLL